MRRQISAKLDTENSGIRFEINWEDLPSPMRYRIRDKETLLKKNSPYIIFDVSCISQYRGTVEFLISFLTPWRGHWLPSLDIIDLHLIDTPEAMNNFDALRMHAVLYKAKIGSPKLHSMLLGLTKSSFYR
jgi:hypothetical protein